MKDSVMAHLDYDEIIVYLDSHSHKVNGRWELLLDFRSNVDFELFQKEMDMPRLDEPASCILIDRLNTNKRLRTDCYYRLNTSQLKKARFRHEENSYLFAARFDCEEIGYVERPDDEVLLSHSRLTSDDLDVRYGPLNLVRNDQLLPTFPQNLELYVADVGQANWNELRGNGDTLIVFDCGAPTRSKREQVELLWKRYKPCNNGAKLIISHWDLDHYHCLIAATDKELTSLFTSVYCVSNPRSLMSKTQYTRLQNLFGEKFHAITPPPRQCIGISQMELILKDGAAALYIGACSQNINYCGLCLYANGNFANVLFTGDLKLSQCDEVACAEHVNASKHILITPHHGGNSGDKAYANPISCSIISVDEKGNTYGHPNQSMLNYLIQSKHSKIMRTDLDGEIQEML